MPVRPLPDRPSLENLRKQAKDLLAAIRRGEPAARDRLAAAHPRGARAGRGGEPALADAQLAIAREHGLPTWAALVRHVGLGRESRPLHELDLLFRSIPGAREARRPLLDGLEREVDALLAADASGAASAATLVRLADAVAGSGGGGALAGGPLDRDRAREAIARWHRFGGWADVVRHADRAIDPGFEAAADAIVSGEVEVLRDLLARRPALVSERSPFGHRAALLHYVAANGVEDSRQWQSPREAVALARLLLAAGAEPDAVCDAYGGVTPLGLVVSSVHPARAGVQVGLVDALVDGGAAVEGPGGDGGPLLTALAFGYLPAARALVRRGARVDTVVAAAGLGRVEEVQACFDAAGALRPDRARPLPVAGVSADPRAHVDRALVWAGRLGHPPVVSFLIDRGADLAAADEQGFTALHWAAFRADLATMRVLLDRAAPLDARNAYGGTVLEATRWAAANAPAAGADYPAAIALLEHARQARKTMSPPETDG